MKLRYRNFLEIIFRLPVLPFRWRFYLHCVSSLKYISILICIWKEIIDLCHKIIHLNKENQLPPLMYSMMVTLVHRRNSSLHQQCTVNARRIQLLHTWNEFVRIYCKYINVLCNNFILKSANIHVSNRLIASGCQLDLYESYIPWNILPHI